MKQLVLDLCFGFLALAILAGCSTHGGIPIPIAGASQHDVDDFFRRNTSSPTSAAPPSSVSTDAVKTSLVADIQAPSLIIIGNTMALKVFDESTLSQRYDNFMAQVGAQPRAFGRDWYMATGSGETRVQHGGVTGIYSRFCIAEVPRDLVEQLGFSSALGVYMAGTSADLVVAQGSPGYGTWITHLLCSKNDPDYKACASGYRRGLYQSADGREVDSRLRLVAGGATIDPVSFKRINPSVVPSERAPPQPESTLHAD